MSKIARRGDPSSHGGIIITSSTNVTANNIVGVARQGDLHYCPLQGHGVTFLTGTKQSVKVDGRVVIRVGDSAGCGAKIIQGSPDIDVTN